MSGYSVLELSLADVPYLDSVVFASGYELIAVGAKVDRDDALKIKNR